MKSVLLPSLAIFAIGTEERLNANPIRRVVNLLQAMQKKVEEEGEKEEELYEKFVCYCKNNKGELTQSIAEAQTKIAQLETQAREDTSAKAQLDEELRNHKKDREEAHASIAGATKIREKDAMSYAKESGDTGTNIAALKKAIDALEQGLSGGAFLQAHKREGEVLKLLATQMSSLSDMNRESLTAFLSQNSNGSTPGSSEIVGILKEMKDEMSRDYKALIAAEETAIAQFQQLKTAKTKEIAAATAAIERKTQRSGELAVKIVQGRNDLEDTIDGLSEDEQFQVNLRRDCDTKEKDQHARMKTRSEELQAIAETIKVLNDDDALDLFKKTLPSPGASSLLQQGSMTKKAIQARARALIQGAAQTYRSPGLDFISLALRGKKMDFSKVLKLIDNLVVVLKKEQTEDDEHKAFCALEFDSSDDEKKATKRRIQDLAHEKQEALTASKNLAAEIKALQAGIAALDKSVAEATALRQGEHAEYVQTSAANSAALKLIAFAKNRMNKFYNPKMYKAPPPRELTEEERVYSAYGGELEPVVAGGIAGTGISATVFLQMRLKKHSSSSRAAPPPPPETFGAYSKKSGESNGVISLMDMLMNDLKKDIQAADFEEKDSQAEYEDLMTDSQKKRAADSTSITTKESNKAEADSVAETAHENWTSANADLKATKEYIANLHKSCDFLVENYDFRKAARAQEIDALSKAKAVLRGSDYSLVETKSFLRKAHFLFSNPSF